MGKIYPHPHTFSNFFLNFLPILIKITWIFLSHFFQGSLQTPAPIIANYNQINIINYFPRIQPRICCGLFDRITGLSYEIIFIFDIWFFAILLQHNIKCQLFVHWPSTYICFLFNKTKYFRLRRYDDLLKYKWWLTEGWLKADWLLTDCWLIAWRFEPER